MVAVDPQSNRYFPFSWCFAHRSMHGVLNGYSNRRVFPTTSGSFFCSNTHAHEKSFQRTRPGCEVDGYIVLGITASNDVAEHQTNFWHRIVKSTVSYCHQTRAFLTILFSDFFRHVLPDTDALLLTWVTSETVFCFCFQLMTRRCVCHQRLFFFFNMCRWTLTHPWLPLVVLERLESESKSCGRYR